MENLRRIIGMYFQNISSHNILRSEVHYEEFKKEDFDALSKSVFPCLSDTDTDALYAYLKHNVEEGENGLNVFMMLKLIANEFVTIRNDKPICYYNKILKWRELTKSIGEDLPICAFLAYRTQKTGYVWTDFEWDVVIGHDNMQLNRIMQRGISDNHFHLFGSAPAFQLIWLKLMNHLVGEKYVKALEEIDREKRRTRVHYSKQYKEDSLVQMHFQATLIRAMIFSYIENIRIDSERDGREYIRENYQKITNILREESSKDIWCLELQNYLYSLKHIKKCSQNDETGDYANLGLGAGSVNHEFEGERALIYHMLCGEVDGEPIPIFMMNWFYAYLAIQVKFREELVQVNDTIGFENFSQYTKRKGKFFYTALEDEKMIQHAVRGSFEPGNLKSLELRITPCKTAEENRTWIKTCDRIINACMKNEQRDTLLEDVLGLENQECLRHIYYVFHFPKKADEELDAKDGFVHTCRHDRFRKELNRKTKELISFREKYPKEASRVLGIDACSQEIGCRPEVFAIAFEKLANHVVQGEEAYNIKQWKITYHVGEDARDFTDGLRAIDEAIRFLKMGNGDRLGHATFLGMDVRTWYAEKRNVVYLSLQDYLDNVVWLYYKLIEFQIPQSDNLKSYLLAEYERCFKMLYGSCMENYYLSYGIHTYYEAWKNRDKNPHLYRYGEYKGNELDDWGENTSKYVKEEKWYNKKEILQLLYYYHYSADVRCGKNHPQKIRIPELYVDGVEKVQRALQQYIAEKGICVEANPSSNLVISSMKRYGEHPISNIYNMGLINSSEELMECPQIHVSINTDDKGVFHTSLENEYALMGRAMEQIKDENGIYKYRKQMVYDWLERIRQNGNQQSFLNDVADTPMYENM